MNTGEKIRRKKPAPKKVSNISSPAVAPIEWYFTTQARRSIGLTPVMVVHKAWWSARHAASLLLRCEPGEAIVVDAPASKRAQNPVIDPKQKALLDSLSGGIPIVAGAVKPKQKPPRLVDHHEGRRGKR